MAVTRERQLGDILVDNGVLTPIELDEALQRQRMTGEMLGRVLVTMDLCEEQDIVEALGQQAGMERIDLSRLSVGEEVLRMLSPDVVRFYNVVPVRYKDGVLTVAMADPLNISVLDDLRQIVECEVEGAISNQQAITKFVEDNYSYQHESIHQTLEDLIEHTGDAELTLEETGTYELISNEENLVELAQEPEVIKIVNLVLLETVQKRGSDIHFEVYEEDFRIRVRVDGVLQEIVSPPKHMALALVSRCKILSNMDIAERRLPQDARIELKVGDSIIDIRAATLPTLYGENFVMRILDQTAVRVDINQLGFADDVLKKIHTTIQKPNGIFLCTGPTGTGKTTTLYACINELNHEGVKIITTEDPVEMHFDQIIQVQVKEDIGLTFAYCLRSILRQDPDIILVGEIRDLPTAHIAVEASLTGHIVLSTLHTNSAPETITRLLDMELEPFLITSSLEGVMSQRLARVLCKHCREPYRPDDEEMDTLGVPHKWRKDPNLRMFRPKGCPACDYMGYLGRTSLVEFLEVDEPVKDMILSHATSYEIRDYARKYQGMRTMREEGIIACARGKTSPEEVITHTDRYI
ncbi:MAG: ATPase, T2SS/T4P/T4SS family [Candidatus Hydrogenedentota bacterium]